MSKEFFDAIRSGDRDKVSALLAADAALLGAKDENGLNPYVAAKYSGRNEMAALLLERGVELDIFAACMAGAEQRVVELVRGRGELVNGYSHDGWTPLHLACFFGNPGVAEALLAYGADVHARSRNPMQNTPLHAAAGGRSRDAVRALIEHGGSGGRRTQDGERDTRIRGIDPKALDFPRSGRHVCLPSLSAIGGNV